jgi:eukaryotic-like serine/threonine-protein kinase
MNEESLFEEALTRPIGERAAFLDRACAGRPELRASVETMLAAHERSGDVLDRPLPDLAPTLDVGPGRAPLESTADRTTGPGAAPRLAARADGYRPDAASGAVIGGRYTLHEKIGEGGMGEVWVAQQTEPVKRLVALKLIKAGMDSRAVIQRFEQERQALAIMDHPNIARVLDGGLTPNGQPFFVMELVDGLPLTKFCDEAKLPPKERLELFVPICRAVQHAHQKGVVHRDLKPANILVTTVDGRPVPKVIDFGVAKATAGKLADESLVTQFGSVVGTPEYMSPEQAGAPGEDIDTRADIYSLGVVLYELLTGLRPIDAKRLRQAALSEMIRVIREVEPSKPSTRLSTDESLPSLAAVRQTEPRRLMAMLRGDLDWVVMKCLEKHRERRYETASGLARDIQRYLDGDPVEACPPSVSYRLGKFARKHRAAMATAGAFALLLISATAISVALAYAADRERDRATAAEAKTRDERDRALKAEAQARAEADKAKAINDFLTADLLAQAEPAKNAAEDRVTLLDVLDRAADRVGRRFEGKPEVEAAVRESISRAYHGLAAWDKAERQARALRELARRPGADPDEFYRAEGELAHVLRHRGQVGADTLEMARSAAEGLKRVLGPEHLTTLVAMSDLAVAYLDSGQRDVAVPIFEETLKALKAKLGPDHPDTLSVMNNLAVAYGHAGRLDLALPLHEETLRLTRARQGPDHPDTLTRRNNLAETYVAAGKADLALPLYEETLKLMKARLGPDHLDTLVVMNNLAEAYNAAGKPARARPLLEEALRLRRAKLPANHPDVLTSMNNLAESYKAAGDLSLALPLLEEAHKVRKAARGPEHPDTLAGMNNLGDAYKAAGKLDLALPIMVETLRLRRATLGPDHPDTLGSMNNLALTYQAAGDMDRAIPLLEETLKASKVKLGPDHPKTIGTMHNLATAYQKVEKPDRALPLFEETLRLARTKLGPEHPITLACANGLATAYYGAGDLDRALPLMEETLKIREATLGPDHPSTLDSINNLGSTYWSAKRLDKSVPTLEEALRRHQRKLGRDHPFTLETMVNLGVNYKFAGRLADATPLLEEGYRASKKHPGLAFAAPVLLDVYVLTKDQPKMTALAKEILAEARRTSPAGSPKLAQGLAPIGLALLQAGDFAGAEPILRETLAIREKTQPDAWSTFNTKSTLGGALLGQKKYAEAEPLLLQGFEGMKQRETTIPPLAKIRLTEALERLVQVYEAQGKQADAAKWRKELDARERKTLDPKGK